MAVRVDQAGKDRAALRIDDVGVAEPEHFAVKQMFHPAVIADQDAGEALQSAVRVDLDAVEVVDERIGVGPSGEQRCGEREDRFVHASGIALFAAR